MYAHERRSRDYYEGRARWYDWANRLAALLRGTSATRERRKAVRRLNLKPGDCVLEVSVGTGTNLPLIATRIGHAGRIVGLDISSGMLGVCARKMREKGVVGELVEGEAGHLPFANGAFDAVFNHGGIAEFGDRGDAITEMYRVVKPGGRVVVCDVGVPEDGRLSFRNRLLLRLNPAYDQPPPMDVLPEAAQNVSLRWYFGGGWYMIDFTKPE